MFRQESERSLGTGQVRLEFTVKLVKLIQLTRYSHLIPCTLPCSSPRLPSVYAARYWQDLPRCSPGAGHPLVDVREDHVRVLYQPRPRLLPGRHAQQGHH